jgi:phosphatidylethanolamine/phosphatidyl-N-methylethanolamine N-methyltransferase
MERKRDERKRSWTFFRQWLKNPLAIAAISPSSKELAQKMLKEIPRHGERLIELGAGTGVFTREILAQGYKPDNLLVLELNQALHLHLQEQFPSVRVLCADAQELDVVAKKSGFLSNGSVDAVISGLGMLSMGKSTQKAILSAAFSVMNPQGKFIQFTYGPTNPVASEVRKELGLSSHRGGFTLWNMPPAVVYVLSRTRAKRMDPVKNKVIK